MRVKFVIIEVKSLKQFKRKEMFLSKRKCTETNGSEIKLRQKKKETKSLITPVLHIIFHDITLCIYLPQIINSEYFNGKFSFFSA